MLNKNLKIIIDTQIIAKEMQDFSNELKKELEQAISSLAAQTHAHIIEDAQQTLSSATYLKFRGDTGAKNLIFEQISPGLWTIGLDQKAMWIEEGIPPNTDMKEWFFKDASKVKISKQGHHYRSMNFNHGKSPSSQTLYEKELTNKIKNELDKINRQRKRQGQPRIPWTHTIEEDKNGSPRLGKLYEFEFSAGKKSGKEKIWSHDPLHKLAIYQSEMKDSNGKTILDKNNKPKIKRSFLTFRTASDNPNPSIPGETAPKDKFIHPGYEGKKFLDKAYDWALQKWDTEILPDILNKWRK